MRKILLIIVIILVIAFGYISLTKGIQIGNLKISSIMQIDEESKKLEAKTQEVNHLIDVEYPKKNADLKDANTRMQEAKTKYTDETNLSSDEEIQSALQIESYDIERLYVKLGMHANKEGVNLKFVLNSSSSGSQNTRDITFTLKGSYIGITNFIYAIEDDEELNFRIYNFKLSPAENELLEGSFVVHDVRITSESLNEQLTSSIQNNNNNTQTDNNKTQTNTTKN